MHEEGEVGALCDSMLSKIQIGKKILKTPAAKPMEMSLSLIVDDGINNGQPVGICSEHHQVRLIDWMVLTSKKPVITL